MGKKDDEYIKEWRDLCRPIEEFMGLKHWAFDPDVAFELDKTHRIDLPVWFLERFNEALKKVSSDKAENNNSLP
jgi:hypothetical protein